MSKIEKIFLKVMSGQSDKNIEFDEVITLLKYYGFELRIKGSHHLFRFKNMSSTINIQRDGHLAKPYQIKQIRLLLKENNLGVK